jgi:lysophospholipase L1-like esterase
MKKFVAVVLGVMVMGWTGSEAHAQGGWLDKGSDFLKGLSGGSGTGGSGVGALSNSDIASGLVEALKVGTDRVVSTLGRNDGFNKSPDVHIPLPGTLAKVKAALKPLGLGGMADDLELRLNRAAEAATPRAKRLFWDAITQMTLDDARKIYSGPKDAATQYFRGKMSQPLARDMQPIVGEELGRVGAVQAYDRMIGRYRSLPFVPDAKADLTQYVLEKAIDGIFLYLGREEAAIRENPAKRTTALLQKVFGAR